LLLAIACWVMSEVNNVPMMYVGFTLIRCLGQGAMWLVGTWIVGEWFLRKRGFATAVSGVGSSLSVVCFPMLNLYLIEHLGWQSTWKVLGCIVAVTIVVPAMLFLRNRPEDIGLLPDGDTPEKDVQKIDAADAFAPVEIEESSADHDLPDDSAPSGLEETNERNTPSARNSASVGKMVSGNNVPTEEAWPLSEVLRDATFWKLLSVGVCTGMIGTGLVFHQETIFAEHGISKQLAMGIISLQAAIGTAAALGVGWLTDKYPAERLLAAAMLMLSVSVGLITIMPHWTFVFVFAVLNGLHGAILRTAGTVVWVNYYGRQNQGVIRGAAMSAMILAAAVGPIPLAMANDRLGTYGPTLIAFTIIPLLSMLLVLNAKQPRRPAVLSN